METTEDIQEALKDLLRDTVYHLYYQCNESLNGTYRKLNRQRSVYPSDKALLKVLYLATFETTKKWAMPICN